MSGVIITALSDIGQAAIENIMLADNGRNDWKIFLKETVLSDRPYSIKIEFKHAAYKGVFTVKHMVEVIQKQMTSLKAEESIDYEVKEL